MKRYRIYINDNTLYIAATAPELAAEIQQLEVQGFNFQSFYKKISKVSGKSFLLMDADPRALFQKIKKSCLIIKVPAVYCYFHLVYLFNGSLVHWLWFKWLDDILSC